MGLHSERTGEGPRLVLVHGFTQTGRSWRPIVPALALEHEVVTVDAPGHGASAGIVADLPTGAELLIEAGGPATYVGYSMGARFCLHAALTEPASVRQLVLISGTAGIGSAADRAERRAADAQLADHIDEIGVDAFLREWLALPLFAGLSSEAADVDDRRRNTAAGLRSSLEHAGTGTQEPLWDRLDTLAMPVLVVAGSDDPKFRALAERMATAIGAHAELQVIAGAGHTVHLERPDQFLEALTDWLHRHGA